LLVSRFDVLKALLGRGRWDLNEKSGGRGRGKIRFLIARGVVASSRSFQMMAAFQLLGRSPLPSFSSIARSLSVGTYDR